MAVSQAHAAHVPVVGVAGDQVGERQLAQRFGSVVGVHLGVGERLDEAARERDPGKSQSRREGFRGRADIHDVIWRGSLQGAYRLAVVAELTVVVVLDDEAAAGARPLDQRSAPRGVEGSADRVLVRGRDDDRAYVWQRTLEEQ